MITIALLKVLGCQHPVSEEPGVYEDAMSIGGIEQFDLWSRTNRVRRKPLVKR